MAAPHNPKNRPSALQQYRVRQKGAGFARVEVKVRREDAALVRDIAQRLSNPRTEVGMRLALNACLDRATLPSLKDHLCTQPFDELEFERSDDPGRTIAL